MLSPSATSASSMPSARGAADHHRDKESAHHSSSAIIRECRNSGAAGRLADAARNSSGARIMAWFLSFLDVQTLAVLAWTATPFMLLIVTFSTVGVAMCAPSAILAFVRVLGETWCIYRDQARNASPDDTSTALPYRLGLGGIAASAAASCPASAPQTLPRLDDGNSNAVLKLPIPFKGYLDESEIAQWQEALALSLTFTRAAIWAAVTVFALVLTSAYLIWWWRDRKTPFAGGSDYRLPGLRCWSLWQHWRAYFPVSLHIPSLREHSASSHIPDHVARAKFPANRNYILGMHPHGLYCFGGFANFVAGGPDAPFATRFPHIRLRLATLKFNFTVCPLWREVNLSYGFISVDFKSCLRWLVHGTAKPTRLNVQNACQPLTRMPASQKRTRQAAAQQSEEPPAYVLQDDDRDSEVSMDISNNGASKATDKGPHERHDSGIADDDTDGRAPSPIEDPVGEGAGCHSLPPDSPNGAGRALLIVIGGAEESLYSLPDAVRLVLRKRKGFVRLALTTGSSLVPCFSYGENAIYDQIIPKRGSLLAWGQRAIMKIAGWTVPLCKGRLGIWVPYKRPIVTVVGDPLHLPYDPNPSRELVEHWHQIYVRALQDLWKNNLHLDPCVRDGKEAPPLEIIA